MRKSLSKLLVIGGIAGAVTLASLPSAFGSPSTITNVVITQVSNTVTVVTFLNGNEFASNFIYLGSVDGLQNTNNWAMSYDQGSIAASASGTTTISGLQYGHNYYFGIAALDGAGNTNNWYPLTSGGTSTSFTLGFFQPSSGPVPASQWPSLPLSFTNQAGLQQTNGPNVSTQISNLIALVTGIQTNLLKFPQH